MTNETPQVIRDLLLGDEGKQAEAKGIIEECADKREFHLGPHLKSILIEMLGISNLSEYQQCRVALKNQGYFTSSITLHGWEGAIWQVRIPMFLTDKDGWDVIGPEFAGRLNLPGESKEYPSLQGDEQWIFFHRESRRALRVETHSGSQGVLLVAYAMLPPGARSEDDYGDFVNMLEELLSYPNPYRGNVLSVNGDGSLSFYHMPHERISPYTQEVEEAVQWFLAPSKPEVVERMLSMGIAPRTGMVIEGPPGAGKTTLARRMIRDRTPGVTVLVVGNDTSAEMAFGVAAMFSPSMLIFEDAECYFGRRGSTTFSAFLNALDGFEQSAALMVLATTNDSSDFDEAVRRAGRLERRVVIDRVSPEGVMAIMTKVLPDETDEVRLAAYEALVAQMGNEVAVTPAILTSFGRDVIIHDLKGREALVKHIVNRAYSWEGASYLDGYEPEDHAAETRDPYEGLAEWEKELLNSD